ncbi:MAG TPA: GMC oxidoreductase, partial [Paracoccaceae bacterium]|nr:GMC oxidoreductase [Paracoccaceae bacterium]
LMHTHIGLNPTLEFHSLARDRQWFQLAVNEVAAALARDFALDARAWKTWQAAPRVALGGGWRITGYLPGKGAFEGLRVADSSIFPRVTNGNLNAPSIMTGEKAADHILGRGMLAPANSAPWNSPRWASAQR